jgi:hypothetical protein
MQNSISNLVQRFKVLTLYKELYKHLRVNKVERVVVAKSGEQEEPRQPKQLQPELYLNQLRIQFRQNSVTDGRYCMQKDEMFFMGNAYASYLKSTDETLALYAKYAKGERSIEQAANIVGLNMPKLYQDKTNDDHK